MKLSNSASDYTETERADMAMTINGMIETMSEINEILDRELANPTPPVDNVVYLDMHSFTEYSNLLGEVKPIDEVISLYEKWTDKLWELCHLNVGNFNQPKVVEFLIMFRGMCGTFSSFFEKPKNDNAD